MMARAVRSADRKSTRLNSSHLVISYAVFCLKKKIYEVTDVYPMHYSMLTLDRTHPEEIRNEFMTLIEKEWQQGSKSTWIEIVASPTGYIMPLTGGKESNFIRKNIAPLTGAEVNLLSDQTVQKFICYTPKDPKAAENYRI